MQLKLSFATLALASLAVANPLEVRQTNQCNTGSLQCCTSISSASDPATALLLGLLGAVVQNVNIPVGINCTPITVVGVSGSSCTADPVCCTNNSFNGLVALGCTPISASL